MSDNQRKVQQSDHITVDRFNIQREHIQSTCGEMDFSYISFEDGVCVLAMTDENEVVIVNKYRHAVKEWEWELPSGMIDQHEEPLKAAQRELAAETGYDAEVWISLGHFHPSASSTSETIHLFAASKLRKLAEPVDIPDCDHEVILKQWEDVIEMIQDGDFKHGAGLAAILKYQLKQGN